jgi:uncharacterized protein YbcI
MSSGSPEQESLSGGRLLAEITNRIVAFTREHYGRGPIKAKTYVLDNLIVCVLSNGFTPIEQTMMEGGEPHRVLEMRRDFQRMMKVRYSAMIEDLTGRRARPHDRDVSDGRTRARIRRARARRSAAPRVRRGGLIAPLQCSLEGRRSRTCG